MARTAIAYIDGFNFYHGAVRAEQGLKWLDFDALCRGLVRGCNLIEVNYYTARVRDQPSDLGQSQRQDDYLRALGEQPRTTVILGQFQRKKSTVSVPVGTTAVAVDGSRVLLAAQGVRGKVWEEKGSDVNLGVDLSWDACSKRMDVALVLSNDLDLQRAVTRAETCGIEVVVVNPHQRTNTRPSLVGSSTRRLHRGDLRRCQLPDEVPLNSGGVVRRPATWS